MNENNPALSDPYLLAIHFEQAAKDLYANLALVSQSVEARRVFARLANEEAVHIGLFRNLRTASAANPPTAEFTERALALMRTHILPVPGAVSGIAMRGGRAEALELALKLERDSMSFYRDLLPLKPALQDDLARIIHEEQRHSNIISSLLKAAQDEGTSTRNPLLSK